MKTNAEPTKKIGRLKAGKKIISSSWKVFKLEPGLVAVEIISWIVGLILLLAFLAGFIALTVSISGVAGTVDEASMDLNDLRVYALLAFYYVISGSVHALFSGWFSHIVYQRLDGNDPTVRDSLKTTLSRFGPLSKFGVINGLMYLIFEAIRSRTSFLGDLVSFIGAFAWSVASIFAVPIIVNRKEKIGPITAVKESAGLIKKTWGEGVVSQFGIALVGTLLFVGYILLFAVIGGLAFSTMGSDFGIAAIIVGVLGASALIVLLSMLSSIAQTALYYYAQTGKSPAEFDKELMRSAMTPKKARKIFG